jgi:beta-lactamase regulating signal transducer with metallopeptidase domain
MYHLVPAWASTWTNVLAAWLLTYALHSTLLLGGAWLISRRLPARMAPVEEAVWRLALIAGLVTASLQLAAGREPLAGRWELRAQPAPPIEAAASAPVPPRLAPMAESSVSTPLAAVPAMSTASRPAAGILPSISFSRAATFLVGLWAALALLATLRWAGSLVWLRRRLRARPEIVGGGVHGLLRVLSGETGEEPVRLTCSSRLAVPVAMGVRRREICLPPRALSHLEPEQQEGMLAHELAHLVRRDPFWLALSHLVSGVLFFQPLNWVARRRLRELSELLCDRWAVERTGRPLSLARCLAEVASWSRRTAALPVPSMADRPSSLARRIRRLLEDGGSPDRRVRPAWLVAGGAVVLLGVAAAAPGVSAGSAAAEHAAKEAARQGQAAPAAAPAAEPKYEIQEGDASEAAAAADAADVEGAADDQEPGDAVQADRDDDQDDWDLTPEQERALDKLGEDAGRMADDITSRMQPDLDRLADKLDDLSPDLEKISEQAAESVDAQMSAKEREDFERDMERISERINKEMAPEIERISQEAARQAEEFQKKFPREEIERIQAEAQRMAEHMRPDPAEIEKLRAEAEKMKADGLTDEERQKIREDARRLAEKMRPSAEERKAMEDLRRQQHQAMEDFMKQHRAEMEQQREEIRAQAEAMRQEMRRRLEQDPEYRALRERYSKEMEQEREKLHKEREQRMRDRQQRHEEREKAGEPAKPPVV